MKNLIKYLAVLIVAIVISAAVYVKTSSNNNTVKVQNQEALATKPKVIIGKTCCELYQDELCVWPDGYYRAGDWAVNHQ